MGRVEHLVSGGIMWYSTGKTPEHLKRDEFEEEIRAKLTRGVTGLKSRLIAKIVNEDHRLWEEGYRGHES
jgi:hypothetical protein